jgi:site-specific recombinase XerD
MQLGPLKYILKYLQKADIKENATVYYIRYSFATYLFESGTDPRYIHESFGQKCPNTTEIYTCVRNKDIGKIGGRLDNSRVKG